MRFIPDYRVCYKGRFYECDEEFDIDEKDAEEMSKHGEIVEDPTPPAPADNLEIKEPEKPEEEKPRRGRPRRADNDESGEDAASDE